PDANATWMLGGLSPGPHLLRVVLCRPWHEVVKAPRAFAMVRVWMGPRIPGKAGRAAESVTWPQPRKPILTYVLPVGAPSEQLVRPRVHRREPAPKGRIAARRFASLTLKGRPSPPACRPSASPGCRPT